MASCSVLSLCAVVARDVVRMELDSHLNQSDRTLLFPDPDYGSSWDGGMGSFWS